VIYCDSKSAIAVAEYPVQHRKAKHIQVKFHAIREDFINQDTMLIYCSDSQVSDILTKSLPKPSLKHFEVCLKCASKISRSRDIEISDVHNSIMQFFYHDLCSC
jgi:hypothetical protein